MKRKRNIRPSGFPADSAGTKCKSFLPECPALDSTRHRGIEASFKKIYLRKILIYPLNNAKYRKKDFMLKIGCHLSCAKGFLAMGKEAVKNRRQHLSIFTRNPRGGKAKDLDQQDIAAYLALAEEHGFSPALAHAPILWNACAAEERIREFARQTMQDDLRRLEYLPGSMYNFHPGSHVKQGPEKGIELIAAQLNELLQPTQSTIVLLETMAGKGLRSAGTLRSCVLFWTEWNYRIKWECVLTPAMSPTAGTICLTGWTKFWIPSDQVIGLSRLRAVHLNDSMNLVGEP